MDERPGGNRVAPVSGRDAPAPADDSVVHGRFSLEVERDAMGVLLTVHPPVGGAAVQEAEVLAGLRERGVVHGVDLARLRTALAAGSCERLRIATGTPPEAGTKARFVSLLDNLREQAREVDDDTRVDFRERGDLFLVRRGTAVMRRVPARQGSAGTNVLGAAVPAPPVKDEFYAVKMKGVVHDADDPDLLVAAVDGQPTALRNGVNVDPVVVLGAVDLGSGNVDFTGTLQVRGDIKAGMLVRVSGDVIVQGTVEAARLEVGGTLKVGGGIIGTAGTGGGAASTSPLVSCRGSISALFINHATVSAGGSVVVAREIVNSDVTAGMTIEVGDGRGRGRIVGGACRAALLVKTAVLGSMAGVPTEIQVGVQPQAEQQLAEIAAEIDRIQAEQRKLLQVLRLLQQYPEKNVDGLADRALRTREQLTGELEALTARHAEVTAAATLIEDAVIEVHRRIWDGAKVRIGPVWRTFTGDHMGGKLLLADNEVVIQYR